MKLPKPISVTLQHGHEDRKVQEVAAMPNDTPTSPTRARRPRRWAIPVIHPSSDRPPGMDWVPNSARFRIDPQMCRRHLPHSTDSYSVSWGPAGTRQQEHEGAVQTGKSAIRWQTGAMISRGQPADTFTSPRSALHSRNHCAGPFRTLQHQVDIESSGRTGLPGYSIPRTQECQLLTVKII